jgi:hypothetical protein
MYRSTYNYRVLHLETFLKQQLLSHSMPSYAAWNWYYVLQTSPATCSPVNTYDGISVDTLFLQDPTIFHLCSAYLYFTSANRTAVSFLTLSQHFSKSILISSSHLFSHLAKQSTHLTFSDQHVLCISH